MSWLGLTDLHVPQSALAATTPTKKFGFETSELNAVREGDTIARDKWPLVDASGLKSCSLGILFLVFYLIFNVFVPYKFNIF